MKAWMGVCAGTAALVLTSARGMAAPITVLNPSFESPQVDTTFLPVSLTVESWRTAGPQPYVDVGAGPQNPGTGIFPNPAAAGRFDNADGNQLAYIFSTSTNEFLQTLATNFAATPGENVYQLTVGVGNAGAPPPPTDRLQLQLFYTAAGDDPTDPTKRIFVATESIQNGVDTLSNSTLTDFTAVSSPLLATDAAVGRPINVLISTVGVGGGQFDFDNVRLAAVPEPTSISLLGLGALGLARRRRR